MSEAIGLSIDIETLGGAVGIHPMIQLGVVCFNMSTEKEIDRFDRCLDPKGYETDADTMDWWTRDPTRKTTYDAIMSRVEDPLKVMTDFVNWLDKFKGKELMWFAYPASFDWAFVKFYAWKYGKVDIGYFCHDMSSYGRGILGCKDFSDRRFSKRMQEMMGKQENLAHDAAYDALKQMDLFFKLRKMIKPIEVPSFRTVSSRSGTNEVIETKKIEPVPVKVPEPQIIKFEFDKNAAHPQPFVPPFSSMLKAHSKSFVPRLPTRN